MNRRKILDDKQINWKKKDDSRLSYQMIFDETAPGEISEEDSEEALDVDELLRKRDQKWQEKLIKTREEMYARGLEDGKKQGIEQARAEIDGKLVQIENILREAHREWQNRQKLLEPGILDLTFDLAEAILTIPVENPAIRKKLESELSTLLQKTDEQSRPVLWISEEDLEYIKKLKNEYAPKTTINIRVSKECNPGEFKLETNRETIVHNFKTMLGDLKESLTLPSWNK